MKNKLKSSGLFTGFVNLRKICLSIVVLFYFGSSSLFSQNITPNLIYENICGLSYITGSTRLNQRTDNVTSCPNLSAAPSTVATYNIGGIPTTATILDAFVYFVTVGPTGSSISINGTLVSSSGTFTANLIATEVAPSTIEGGAICWSGYGEQTHLYKADASALMGSAYNGTFSFSGFPSNIAAPSGSKTDTDGATLLIVYQDCNDYSSPRSLYLHEGLYVSSLNTTSLSFTMDLSTFNTGNNILNENFVFAIADVQQYSVSSNCGMPGFPEIHTEYTVNGVNNVILPEFWSTISNSININNSTPVVNFSFDNISVPSGFADCFAIPLMGVYLENGSDDCEFADAGPDVSICGYGCVILDGSGGVQYSWSPGTGLNDPTLENPELCGPNVASTYVVTVTDIYGCIDDDDVSVTFTNANFPPPVITGPDNLCCSDLTFSVPAGFDFYEWILPAGVTISSSNMTGNVITISFTGAAGNYAGQEICVQVTDPQGCVAQSCITLQNCCGTPEPPSSTVSEFCNPSLLSDLIANYSWQNSYTGATLHIQNDLILDQNLSLNNCIVYIDADRKIIVKPGITFNVARTTMQNSCDFMWEGIVLENDLSTVNITFQSKIWQAKNAVVSNLGGKYFLSESEFKNNYKSVVVNNYALVHPGEIKKCTFIGTNYGMLPPHNSDFLPFVGVEVNKVRQVTIGDATIANNTNIFRKLRYGILGNTSNLEIYNNKFEDIKVNIPFSNFINNNTSIAIWAQNGYNVGTPFINIGNTGGIAKNIFKNCTKGIQVERDFNVTVNSNEFTNMLITNVYCRSINGKTIDVLNNTINGNFGVGVLCIDFLKTIVRVNNNQITENFGYLHSGGYRNTGIWLTNVIPNPNIYEVKENIITRCENGIDIIGMPNIIIKDNSVTYTRTNQQIINLNRLHAGIRLYNSQRAEIGLNTVGRTNPNPANNGTSSLTPYLQGIIVELSEQSYVHDNNIQQMGYGMYWRGSSLNSTISCNIMEKCWNGIYFDFAEVGHQGNQNLPSGNYWVTNQDPTGKMDGTLDVANIPVTNWYADLTNNITSPTPQNVPLNQISINPAFGNPNCQIAPGGTTPGPIGPGKREVLFGSILRDEKQFVNYVDETRQQNNRYLYRMLKEDPTLINLGGVDDADYQNFFTLMASENTGKMEDINYLITDTSFSAAGILNSSITPNLTTEVNQKTVNEIYLSTWANGLEIDSTQFYILESIACQNPLEGGPAVYSARVLIGLDYECANGANRSMFTNEGTDAGEKDDNFTLYPNPSSGIFTLLNNGEELEHGKIQVIDITGKTVMSVAMNSTGETKLDLSNLSEGMYYFTVISNNVNVHSDKIIIER